MLAWAPVLADGGPSGIIVTPPRVKAGEEISIRGSALWTELPVTARLVGASGATRTIGESLTGPDGSIDWTVALPHDIPPGQYRVVLENAYGETAEAPIVIEESVPIVALATLGGAVAIALLIVFSAWRRRRVVAVA
jgi:hypothetical protein